MSRRRDTLSLAGLAVTVFLILGSLAASVFIPRNAVPSHLRCAIQLGGFADTTKGLLSGYNRHLLEDFASTRSDSVTIIAAGRSAGNWMDSLRCGAVDILAAAPEGADTCTGVLFSECLDSTVRWAVREGSGRLLKEIDSYFEAKAGAEDHDLVREMFLRTYDPWLRARTGIRYSYLSPYDTLIKESADSLGWDWRLLAALIFQESRFRHDALSRRGARGLMQMMPHTAGRMEADDLTDPSQSIKAGTRYLKLLESRYVRWSATPEEMHKITIAAYNAGEGRIRECINYARWKGVDIKGWDDIASVIPEMNDDAILEVDTVKVGKFKGKETVAYVDRVMEIYGCFRTICP